MIVESVLEATPILDRTFAKMEVKRETNAADPAVIPNVVLTLETILDVFCSMLISLIIFIFYKAMFFVSRLQKFYPTTNTKRQWEGSKLQTIYLVTAGPSYATYLVYCLSGQ